MNTDTKSLETVLGYVFKDKNYLMRALTHSSYVNEQKSNRLLSNERLEFLGDSVLSIIISEFLYSAYGQLEEGQLTKIRARIVCEASLGDAAKQIGLGRYMYFGRGEEITGGRERLSILSDAFEAIIAAIYLDGGVDYARVFVLEKLQAQIESARQGRIHNDYKTQLQEIIQIDKSNKIKYEIYKEEGPDHAKVFYTHVKLNDEIIGTGAGRSKKESEQKAAEEGLLRLKK
ncbi:ribonuclease III [Fusibacter sp. JL298sf-3]